MAILNCYVDDDTLRILEKASIALNRKIAELAEAAISEAAIRYKVDQTLDRAHHGAPDERL